MGGGHVMMIVVVVVVVIQLPVVVVTNFVDTRPRVRYYTLVGWMFHPRSPGSPAIVLGNVGCD